MIARLRVPVATRDGTTSRETARPLAAAATLEQTLGHAVEAAAVEAAVAAALTARVPADPLDPALLQADLARLVIAFAAQEWTWRR